MLHLLFPSFLFSDAKAEAEAEAPLPLSYPHVGNSDCKAVSGLMRPHSGGLGKLWGEG